MRGSGTITCFSLSSVGMLVVGCSNDRAPLSPTSGSIPPRITMPLAVGNMGACATDTDTSTSLATTRDASRVVGTETRAGQVCYVIENLTPAATARAGEASGTGDLGGSGTTKTSELSQCSRQ